MATSYANSGGTGNRNALIWVMQGFQQSSGSPETVQNLVDGATGANTTDSCDFVNGQSGVHIIFDFFPTGFKQVIDEFKWIQSSTTGHGNWDFEGSDDAVTWVPLKTNFALVGGTTTTTHTVSNSTAYRMYRLKHISGTVSSNPWLQEVEFKLEAGAAVTGSAQAYVTGNRTGTITVTTTATHTGSASDVVNGNTTENTFFWAAAQSAREVKFDFGVGASVAINGMRWYQSTAAAHGTWKWAASNDDSTYTDLGLAQTLSRVDGTFDEFTNFGGNTTGYRYYKMIQTSGSTSSTPFLQEIEFRQADGAYNINDGDASLGIEMEVNLGASAIDPADTAYDIGVEMGVVVSAQAASNRRPVVVLLT